jgi:hypothetical protein
VKKHQIEFFMDNRRYTVIQNEASHSEPWKHDRPVISKSTMLPRVLIAEIEGDSISMVRAFKQIKELLEDSVPTTDAEADKITASLNDIETMLAAIS